MSTPVKQPRKRSTVALTGKQEFKANIGQTLVNVSKLSVTATNTANNLLYMIDDLVAYTRRELND